MGLDVYFSLGLLVHALDYILHPFLTFLEVLQRSVYSTYLLSQSHWFRLQRIFAALQSGTHYRNQNLTRHHIPSL